MKISFRNIGRPHCVTLSPHSFPKVLVPRFSLVIHVPSFQQAFSSPLAAASLSAETALRSSSLFYTCYKIFLELVSPKMLRSLVAIFLPHLKTSTVDRVQSFQHNIVCPLNVSVSNQIISIRRLLMKNFLFTWLHICVYTQSVLFMLHSSIHIFSYDYSFQKHY